MARILGESEYRVKNTTYAAAAKRRGRSMGPVFEKYCAQTMIGELTVVTKTLAVMNQSR
jgi:hypothetical protein